MITPELVSGWSKKFSPHRKTLTAKQIFPVGEEIPLKGLHVESHNTKEDNMTNSEFEPEAILSQGKKWRLLVPSSIYWPRFNKVPEDRIYIYTYTYII